MNPFRPIPEELTASNDLNRLPLHRARHCLAFTLIELLVVISIIGVLAALVVALAKNASQSQKRSRIRTELDQVVTAIEAYKAQFGQYPPDNVVVPSLKTVNPVTNQLFYELTGAIVDERMGMFRARDRQQNISSATVSKFFHRDGFVNAGANPKELTSFIPGMKANQRRVISKAPDPDIEVLATSVDWDTRFPSPFDLPDLAIRKINPFRYVRTNPTNNPDGFDLWVEFVEGGRIRIIGNWSKDILDR